MKKVFDIGMYDGADTAYYLECGYQVIAIEANPELVESARQRFKSEILSGQLICDNAAISPNGEPVELILCGSDVGSSTLFGERIADMRPTGKVTVAGVTINQLFEQYGIPNYLKVDIEGADRLCVLALTSCVRPEYLSFEIGNDVDELLSHAETIGFTRFKVINQNSFRELANQRCYFDRIARRFVRYLGYDEPRQIKRAGRFFVTGHSSGPVPWRSDGRWRSIDATRARIHDARRLKSFSGWYDIHATTG